MFATITKILLLLFLIFLFASSPSTLANACEIILKDGRVIESEFCWEEDGKVKYQMYGATIGLDKEKVEKIVDKEYVKPKIKSYGSAVVVLKNGKMIYTEKTWVEGDIVYCQIDNTTHTYKKGEVASIGKASIPTPSKKEKVYPPIVVGHYYTVGNNEVKLLGYRSYDRYKKPCDDPAKIRMERAYFISNTGKMYFLNRYGKLSVSNLSYKNPFYAEPILASTEEVLKRFQKESLEGEKVGYDIKHKTQSPSSSREFQQALSDCKENCKDAMVKCQNNCFRPYKTLPKNSAVYKQMYRSKISPCRSRCEDRLKECRQNCYNKLFP